MNVSSRVLKAHLWQAWAATGALSPTPAPLQPYLQAQAANATALLAAGEIKSNNSNGQVTEFTGEGITGETVVQIWVYLSELFDIATAELQNSTPPIASPTDAQVKAQMELDLRPIKGTTNNFMWLIK